MCCVPPFCPPVQEACAVSNPPGLLFFCAVSPPPPQCSSVPLPHPSLSWILSLVENLTFCMNYQSSSTCISECGTPSWACFRRIFREGGTPHLWKWLLFSTKKRIKKHRYLAQHKKAVHEGVKTPCRHWDHWATSKMLKCLVILKLQFVWICVIYLIKFKLPIAIFSALLFYIK